MGADDAVDAADAARLGADDAVGAADAARLGADDAVVVVRTDRLLLRRFAETEADVAHLVELDSDPAVTRFLTGGVPTSREKVRDEILPRILGGYDLVPGFGCWAAVERRTGEFVGWFALTPSERSENLPDEPPDEGIEAELGYRLRASAWGNGYATEGSRALIRMGFADLGVRRIFAETMAVNVASRRVMEKAGLTFVGTFHLTWDDPIEGTEHGEVEYELRRSDWERRADLSHVTATQAFFASRAETWDVKFGDDIPAYERAVRESGVPTGSNAIDLGCGTGRALSALRAAVGADGAVLGIDVTPEMLAVAATRCASRDRLLLADARRLPLATGSVDVVFAAGLVNHLPDPRAGLGELARVTRAGGRLIIFHPIGRAALAARHGNVLRPDEPLAHARLTALLESTGWTLARYDDAAHRFYALARRAGPTGPGASPIV